MCKKNPKLIQNLFVSPKPNADAAIYGVNFYNLGVLNTVVVDDLVPFDSKNNNLAVFAKPTDKKGKWPIILEKAIVKFLAGTY